MLEDISSLRGQPPLIEHLGVHQPGQYLLQGHLVQRSHYLQELVRKLPPQDCPKLRHLFDHRQPIEPGHQGILQRGWNRQGWQRAGQHIAAGIFPHDSRFQDGLHELFHKQRDAIGLRYKALKHSVGQGVPTQCPLDHRLDIWPH